MLKAGMQLTRMHCLLEEIAIIFFKHYSPQEFEGVALDMAVIQYDEVISSVF